MLKKNKLSDLELYHIEKEKCKYEDWRAISIEALKIVQRFRGWISDDMIIEIAKVLCITPIDLEEIATFYSQIYRKPVGRNIVRYCDSVVCYIMGYKKIKSALTKCLNIRVGQTDCNNQFTLLPISCLGSCDKAPVIMINDETFCNMRDNDIPTLLDKYKI